MSDYISLNFTNKMSVFATPGLKSTVQRFSGFQRFSKAVLSCCTLKWVKWVLMDGEAQSKRTGAFLKRTRNQWNPRVRAATWEDQEVTKDMSVQLVQNSACNKLNFFYPPYSCWNISPLILAWDQYEMEFLKFNARKAMMVILTIFTFICHVTLLNKKIQCCWSLTFPKNVCIFI